MKYYSELHIITCFYYGYFLTFYKISMSCLSTEKTQYYQDKITFWSNLVTTLETTMSAAAVNGEIESYSFDSGDGRQTAKRTTLSELIKDISTAEQMVQYYQQKLNGTGITRLKSGRCY